MQRMNTLRVSASRAAARFTAPTSSFHLSSSSVARCSSLLVPTSVANRQFSASASTIDGFFANTGRFGMSKAMAMYLIVGGAMTGGALGWWLFFNHPDDHELAQQAAVIIERHKDLIGKLYAKPAGENPNAVPVPTNMRVGRMFDSDISEATVDAPQSAKLYIFLPETNLGMGEIHVKGKKRATPLQPSATVAVTADAITPPTDEKKKQGTFSGLSSFVSNMASSVTGARKAVQTPAESNGSAGEIPGSAVPLEWELTDLVLTFPKANKSFVYDTKKYRFVEQTHDAASPAPSQPMPVSVDRAVKVIKQTSNVDSWWKVSALATLTFVLGFTVYRFAKGADARALNNQIISAITKNADIQARMAASSLTAKKTATTYARKSITNTIAGLPASSKEDKSMLNNQYKVTGGGKSATVSVDAMQQTRKDKNGKAEVGWRIVAARITIEGKRDPIIVRGLSL